MRISEALDKYINEYCFDHGHSKATVENYRIALGCFIKYQGDLDVSALTLDHIRNFKSAMENNNRDRNGVISYLYKTRRFLTWLNKQGLLNFQASDIIIPKRRKTLPHYLIPEEINALLNHGDARERAIVSVLYSTAMRVGELVQVRIKDIQGNRIRIRGKGDSERIVFVDNVASHYIAEYLTTRSDANPFLFYSNKKGGLTKGAIQHLIKDLGVRAGINKPVTPHVFRHSNATDLMKNGVGLRYIQEYLGHADISTTQIYTHVAQADLQIEFQKGHKELMIILD